MDFVDLFLVWVVVYRVLYLAQRSGTVQILSGLFFLAAAYGVSIWLESITFGSMTFELVTFNWLLEKFFSNLFLIVVILFQAEIRQALIQIGSHPFLSGARRLKESHIVEELAKAVIQLAQRGYGALIVIEREIALDYFVEMGIQVDASVNSETITAFFHPSSPLHDGALVIRKGRIYSAGCFLPLSKNPVLDKNLGSRHRAAIGLTEETDALVLVVSEESKSVGVVHGGQLRLDVDHASVRETLYDSFGLKMRIDRVSV